jgi:hypothetical protein
MQRKRCMTGKQATVRERDNKVRGEREMEREANAQEGLGISVGERGRVIRSWRGTSTRQGCGNLSAPKKEPASQIVPGQRLTPTPISPPS